jgi:hydroxyethylthiazole kinase-like sugar kinase family protein
MIGMALWPVVSATGDEMVTLVGSEKLTPARLARKLLTSGGIAAVRGRQGVVTDGRRVLQVEPWNEWLEAPEQGAPAGAIIGAFLSIAHLADFITVTAVALGCLGHAADRASRHAKPEAMRSAVVKELAGLSKTPLASKVRITEGGRRSATR